MTQRLLKADNGITLRVWWDTEKNQFHSQAKGRPIFDKVLRMEIIAPGSRESAPVYIVDRIFNEETGLEPIRNERMYEKYGVQIAAFKAGSEEEGAGGFPIDKWPGIDIHQSAECKANRIYTVEALADLPDSRLNLLGPNGRVLREQAKEYLTSLKDGSDSMRAAAEVVTLKEEVERLQAENAAKDKLIAEMSDQLAEKMGSGTDDVDAALAAPAKSKKVSV